MRFFLVDKVTELVVEPDVQRARGIKNVTLSEPILHDHFPDYPIMPGVLILEAASQLAGFLLEQTFNTSDDTPPLRAVLVQIDKAKFHKTAGPGDQLEIEATVSSTLDSAAQVRVVVFVNGERQSRATLTFFMKDIDSERVHAQRRYLYTLWTRDLTPQPTIR